MLKIKDNVDLKELEKFWFTENKYCPNYVYETRSKKGNQIFIDVNKKTKEISGVVAGVCLTPLNDNQIRYFCEAIFEAGFLEKFMDGNCYEI